VLPACGVCDQLGSSTVAPSGAWIIVGLSRYKYHEHHHHLQIKRRRKSGAVAAKAGPRIRCRSIAGYQIFERLFAILTYLFREKQCYCDISPMILPPTDAKPLQYTMPGSELEPKDGSGGLAPDNCPLRFRGLNFQEHPERCGGRVWRIWPFPAPIYLAG
jgi:hypothetical protein